MDRQKLFSDSTKDAKDEGRRKHVAKGMMRIVVTIRSLLITILGGMFFVFTFSSCSSASSRLQKDYRSFNEKLGQTGTGLKYEDVEEGSALSNLIGSFLCLCHGLC